MRHIPSLRVHIDAHMKRYLQHWRMLALVFLVLLNVSMGLALMERLPWVSDPYASSLAELARGPQSFDALGAFFVRLAEEKGAVYAFEVLKRAELPPNTDAHLLGHIVGDELYKQEGIAGMRFCTPDFRNACSHTVVIGALLEEGMAVFDKVHDACRRAPGGAGAYTMCFHGFGHGALAYAGYEVSDAVPLCARVATDAAEGREYTECIGGITMEMVSGIHDRDLWLPMKQKYMPTEDPLTLCRNDAFPNEVKHMCYIYITPQLFEAAGPFEFWA